MIKQDIPLYKLDLTATSEFNHVRLQAGSRREVKQSQIVIPPGAPFYQKSMKITTPDGRPLVLGEDYEFYGIMNKLTAYTAKPVGLFVRFLKDEIKEWVWDYQVVGNFNKLTSEILNMLHSIYEDDRFVLWENIMNKPLWFDPELHQHDLTYDIFGFTDLARELNRIAHIQGTQKSAAVGFLEAFRDHIDFYCKSYRELLSGIIQNHGAHKYDQHAVRKHHIELGLVDNNLTATLEEALEGLRDDLFITPYIAAQVVTAAAGRNDKLYPSGKLPLLRYGSDTFIPPTISGSFEGLGGVIRSHGAIVESDGTLLILQHRNNGKERGLYFIRSQNWRSQDAEYEFTAYRYTHPTATADGANLDVIINGSNRYIMVVGDLKKNIWYWCETHNTFNPDRHILHRMNGPWVSEDMAPDLNSRQLWSSPIVKNVLFADENYREYFCILQSYELAESLNRRPAWGPLSKYQNGGINIGNGVYSINAVRGMSNTIFRCKVDFNHQVFGNSNDYYWAPWWPEITDNPDGKYDIHSMYARYSRPLREVWSFRSTHGLWRKNPDGNDFAFRFMITANESHGDPNSPSILGFHPVYRGKMNFEADGTGLKVTITPGEVEKTFFNIDPYDRDMDNPVYNEYVTKTWDSITVDGADSVGQSEIGDGFVACSDGFGNGTFPSVYQVLQTEYGKGYDKVLGYEASKFYYKTAPVFNELNPIGLGATFINQMWMTADTDNYAMSGMVSKQGDNKKVEMVYRRSAFANANWTHRAPTNVSTYNGRAYRHYPHVSDVKKLNIGPMMQWCQSMPVASNNPQNNYVRIFGCNGDSTLNGYVTRNLGNHRAPHGDYQLPFETQVKVVNNVVTFTHLRVSNVETMLQRDMLPICQAHGFNLQQIKDNYAIFVIEDVGGDKREFFQVSRLENGHCYVLGIVGRVFPQGNTTVKDGGTYYDDSRWESISAPVLVDLDDKARTYADAMRHFDLNSPDTLKMGMGVSVCIPWKSRNDAGVVTDNSSYTIMTRSSLSYDATYGDGKQTVLWEVNQATQQIVRYSGTWGGFWPALGGNWESSPWEGIVGSEQALIDFEGSAVGGQAPLQTDVFESMRIWRWSGRHQVGMTNIITPAYTVYFNEIKNILLAGKMYDVPSTYIDILDQDPNPAGKTYYVYLYYSNNIAQYLISPVVRPESSTQSMIATVICGPTQIDRIIPYNRFSMDGVVISAKRQGSAILASSGTVDGVGDTSTILTDTDYVAEDV